MTINKIKRKLWSYPDKYTKFKNIYNLIKILESLPIIKFTLKHNYDNKNYNKITKKTKKNIE